MSRPSSILKKIVAEVRAVFDEHHLLRDEARLTGLQKSLHFCYLVARSFVDNRCLARASALSYTTLLAMIPLLAVGLTFANSLLKSDQAKVDQWLSAGLAQIAPQLALTNGVPVKINSTNAPGSSNNLPALPSTTNTVNNTSNFSPDSKTGTNAPIAEANARQKILDFVHTSMEGISQSIETGSKLTRTIAVIALLFVGISLLSTIETTLNDIWGVKRGRSWVARIVQYWAAITLGPILLLGALSLNLSTHFDSVQHYLGGAWLPFASQLLPILLLVIAFTLFYQLMPNTKVHFLAALAGGVVGGVLLHLNHMFSTLYAGQVLHNSAVYGSLSIIPIFMVGTYISWVIVLIGAQISYACQNRRVYLQEKIADNLNQRSREFVATRLMTFIGERFKTGQPPATVTELSDALGLPSRLTVKLVQILVQNHLLIEVTGAESAYAPAQPLDKITYQAILEAMRAGYGQDLATRDDAQRAKIRAHLQKIEEAANNVAAKTTLNDPS